MITLDKLAQIFPETKREHLNTILPALNKYMQQYEINTELRIAMFLAQVGHESGSFKYRQENLNYSVDGLLRVFKKYFPTRALAEQYARKPEKIASRVYANRMGNGPEESGDGWKHRGLGYIQLTGKNNHTLFAKFKKMDLDAAVAHLNTVDGAVESACWYWQTNKLNTFADKKDLTGATKTINGGMIGYEDRLKKYNRALAIL